MKIPKSTAISIVPLFLDTNITLVAGEREPHVLCVEEAWASPQAPVGLHLHPTLSTSLPAPPVVATKQQTQMSVQTEAISRLVRNVPAEGGSLPPFSDPSLKSKALLAL